MGARELLFADQTLLRERTRVGGVEPFGERHRAAFAACGVEREERRLRNGELRELQFAETTGALLLEEAQPCFLRDVLRSLERQAAPEKGDDDALVVLRDEGVPRGFIAAEGAGGEVCSRGIFALRRREETSDSKR